MKNLRNLLSLFLCVCSLLLAETQAKSQRVEQSGVGDPQTPGVPTGADAAPGLIWTDPVTKLMWTSKDNGSDVDWYQATAYCLDLQLAGYKGWRTPTIEELQGIYDPNVSAQEMFGDGRTYDVHVKGNLRLTGWTWSSLQGEFPGKPYQDAWYFNFSDPPHSKLGINRPQKVFLHFNSDMRALCVRRPGKSEVPG